MSTDYKALFEASEKALKETEEELRITRSLLNSEIQASNELSQKLKQFVAIIEALYGKEGTKEL